MSLVTILPFVVLIGAMFLMTRSAKKKQQQAADMRNQMQPGSGVRTIGGMYATVKEVSEDTVLLDAGPGVDLLFAKNSIGAVLTDDEYNRIVHGIEHDLKSDTDVVPDDASSLTETDGSADAAAASGDQSVDLGKKDEDLGTKDAAEADEEPEKTAEEKTAAADEEPKKTDGDSDAKK
ncbi:MULTISPECIES: preprotein translocase subunit YajC [Streptomyces]|uniref:Preprotein translocase subunit YajC n=2 Tax=Streptomyces TaxID=1883 RepID=A0ABW9IJG8_STRGJ|nr:MULTISPECIES: preprotein translocase subunit YajC [Streptomyces]MCX5522858.1 preprotein translocase subunit YajC [Streptomyces bobili]QEU64855.1 preprotein translocase subunit YajC [Streptomyces galilaeus]GGW66555.1 preprotein translocase subunit YajC [Streptomyces galilaeus]